MMPRYDELARLVIRYCGESAEALCTTYSRALLEKGDDDGAVIWARVASEVRRLRSEDE